MVESYWSSIPYKGRLELAFTFAPLPHTLTQSFSSALHVMQVRKEQNQNTLTPLAGLLPFFTTWVFIPIYLYQQPIILYSHLIPFVFYIGLINAYSVGQIIIAHLTKSPQFPRYNLLTLPLALASFDSLGPLLGLWPSVLGNGTYQIAFVSSCLGLSVGVYGSFVVIKSSIGAMPFADSVQYDIITTICDYLDIWCLTIKHPYNEKDELKKAK